MADEQLFLYGRSLVLQDSFWATFQGIWQFQQKLSTRFILLISPSPNLSIFLCSNHYDWNKFLSNFRKNWEAGAGTFIISLYISFYMNDLRINLSFSFFYDWTNKIGSGNLTVLIIWKLQTRTPSKISSIFCGTQDKCAACEKTVYPLEKVSIWIFVHMWCVLTNETSALSRNLFVLFYGFGLAFLDLFGSDNLFLDQTEM